ncbi:DHHW family protein [Oscillospiraceae bacterium MB08-C2-2]|nr:DHHW family protein [Oscillospiraceae bacterium MB08-C2-2]
MVRHLMQFVLAVCLLVIPTVVLTDKTGEGFPIPFTMGSLQSGTFTGTLEAYVRENIPFREELRRLGLDLRYAGGSREQSGIFLNENGLMKNFDQPNPQLGYTQRNTDSILAFSEALDIPAYMAVIPTACAVRQQYLPTFAQPVNQKKMIEEIYSQVTGHIATADVYSTLFNHGDEYIYYRTDDRLTALGGYYAYTVLGQRLGIDNRAYSQFDIQYVTNSYDGPLYRLSPYKNVNPDSVQVLRYSQTDRQYLVNHWGENPNTYNTLYPTHLAQLGQESRVYLGGLSGVTDVKAVSSDKSQRSLLVFCDESTLPFITLLANHYSRITLIDLFQATEADYEDIELDEYSQVLFAYGIETYTHTNIPSRLGKLAQAKGLELEGIL